MKIGTKSVLFGAHAFWLHPWFVAWAWWKLYGFPKELWLWIAFFVHDLGYWGKPNMDGPEGETHPVLGAKILLWLEYKWLRFFPGRRLTGKWCNEVLYHSRFLAQKHDRIPSNLAWADKLSIALIPWWLYLPMAIATGEVWEYVNKDKHHSDMHTSHPNKNWGGYRWRDAYRWFRDLQPHMRNVAAERRHVPAA